MSGLRAGLIEYGIVVLVAVLLWLAVSVALGRWRQRRGRS